MSPESDTLPKRYEAVPLASSHNSTGLECARKAHPHAPKIGRGRDGRKAGVTQRAQRARNPNERIETHRWTNFRELDKPPFSRKRAAAENEDRGKGKERKRGQSEREGKGEAGRPGGYKRVDGGGPWQFAKQMGWEGGRGKECAGSKFTELLAPQKTFLTDRKPDGTQFESCAASPDKWRSGDETVGVSNGGYGDVNSTRALFTRICYESYQNPTTLRGYDLQDSAAVTAMRVSGEAQHVRRSPGTYFVPLPSAFSLGFFPDSTILGPPSFPRRIPVLGDQVSRLRHVHRRPWTTRLPPKLVSTRAHRGRAPTSVKTQTQRSLHPPGVFNTGCQKFQTVRIAPHGGGQHPIAHRAPNARKSAGRGLPPPSRRQPAPGRYIRIRRQPEGNCSRYLVHSLYPSGYILACLTELLRVARIQLPLSGNFNVLADTRSIRGWVLSKAPSLFETAAQISTASVVSEENALDDASLVISAQPQKRSVEHPGLGRESNARHLRTGGYTSRGGTGAGPPATESMCRLRMRLIAEMESIRGEAGAWMILGGGRSWPEQLQSSDSQWCSG
ncbi:hypothetical protein C8R46DRAFT_1194126 [Mycena filopes]|nr:hypothetical protein C8R46DRAFT_1194126 [Mycena filopes]